MEEKAEIDPLPPNFPSAFCSRLVAALSADGFRG